MKKIITALFLGTALLSAYSVKAATTDTVKTKGWYRHNIEGAAQIQFTYRQAKVGQLNQALNYDGFPSLKVNDYWINASMSHVAKNWLWEDGIGFSPEATTTEGNNIKAKYSQYQAFLRVGYNVLKSPDCKLYPFAGINASAAVLNIQDNNRIQLENNFTDELLNNTASKTLYQPNFGIELGAGFDYSIKMKPKTTDCFTIERSIPVGIRAGYYINTYAGDWKVDNYKLQTGPNQKQSNVFVSLSVGLGYKIKK